jgi:polar amino acid transport system substrate-binding protein
MSTTHWLATVLFGLLLAGCAEMNTSPSPEVRQVLAPTGKLRVGLYRGAPSSVLKDSATGEMKGVGFDLGKQLALRMAVPFEPVVYPTIGDLIGNANTEQWDVTFVSITPERAKNMDFTSPHLGIEFGYLVRAGSSISDIADVDRPGVKVAVATKGSSDTILSRDLKNAELVRVQGQPGALEALKSGKADVFSAIKSNLFELSGELPGSRVLDGHYAIDQQGMAMPKGREAAMAYANKFIIDAKSEGLVRKAVERSGLRGAVETPRH